MYNFNRLEVCRRADAFSDVVRKATMKFPKFEMYALGDQMRRSADSVVANIEEGGSKESNAEILQYLRHAVGSASELEGWIKRAGRADYLAKDEFEKMSKEIVEIRKMLLGFMKRFRK